MLLHPAHRRARNQAKRSVREAGFRRLVGGWRLPSHEPPHHLRSHPSEVTIAVDRAGGDEQEHAEQARSSSTIHALRRIIWIPGVRRGVVEFEGGPKRASRRQRDRRFETERLPLVMIPVRDFVEQPTLTITLLLHHPEPIPIFHPAW